MLRKTVHAIRQWNKARRVARRSIPTTRPHVFGVLAIMKNEALNIDEFVEHYLWMGAGKIFLIDNGSTDATAEKARAWQSKGHVELVQYAEKYKQREHYTRAFKKFDIANHCEWLLIADLDEFWFCPAGDRLADALAEYSRYDLIYGNWVTFGSSGYVDHPESIRSQLIHRSKGLGDHDATKYFCRTKVLKRSRLLHVHKVDGARSSRTISDNERFQLNHYQIQSLEYFRTVKMLRGDALVPDFAEVRNLEYFRRCDEACTIPDRRLADLVAAAKKNSSR